MSETNTNDTTITNNSAINIGYRRYGIDLRSILLALRYELLWNKIIFGPKFTDKVNVVIPTLRRPFKTYCKGEYIIITAQKRIKIPYTADENGLSIQTIDIITAYLEKSRINYPKVSLSARLGRIDRSDIPTLEFP